MIHPRPQRRYECDSYSSVCRRKGVAVRLSGVAMRVQTRDDRERSWLLCQLFQELREDFGDHVGDDCGPDNVVLFDARACRREDPKEQEDGHHGEGHRSQERIGAGQHRGDRLRRVVDPFDNSSLQLL